jgi:DNA-binding transcriptional ArsR family regulator
MIEVKLTVDTLGQTRFGYSPLAEVACSIRALGMTQVDHLLQPWLHDVRNRLKSVDLELLLAVQPAGFVTPDFLYPWSPDPKVTIEQQLAVLAELPIERLRDDLELVWAGNRMPTSLTQLRDAGASRYLAEVIWRYWTIAVEPYWPRIRSVIDDDVSYRAGRVLTGGLYDLLSNLHPEVTLGEHALLINKPHHANATYTRPELTLVPSVFVWPNLRFGEDSAGKFDIMFPARGVGRVWEGMSDQQSTGSADDALRALLGRTRATILARLVLPMTTTQLASDLHQSPGTISAHLSVLRESGLLTSWRSGRKVLYRQTPLATSIIAGQVHGPAGNYAGGLSTACGGSNSAASAVLG